MRFDLPILDVGTLPATFPAFITAAYCRLWLGEQMLTNAVHMQEQLFEQIDLLNQYPIELAERFGILEALQSEVAFVQDEQSRRYTSKPLPFPEAETKAFTATCALWDAVTVGYLRCIEEGLFTNATAQTMVTLVERALATLLSAQIDRIRAYAVPDSKHWSRMHQLLSLAEARGLSTIAVSDKANYGDQPVTPLAVYAEAMLLRAAGAHEFPARPLGWALRWVRRWGSKLVLHSIPPADLKAMPICVDIGASSAPSVFPFKTQNARFLDTTELSKSIRIRLALLEQGKTPAEVQLGDDCTQPGCQQLLDRLHQRWCKGGMQRPADRHAATGSIELIGGADAIWFHLSGSLFKQPRRADDQMLRRDREEIATFGRVSDRHDAAAIDSQIMRRTTHWEIVNEGVGGLGLLAKMKPNNPRLGVGQLVAVKRADGIGLSLASIRWFMVDDESYLHTGISFLAGTAKPLSFRNAGVNAGKDLWRPAFFLSVTDANQIGSTFSKEPDSLVLPSGVFRPNRIIDVEGFGVAQLHLGALLERGEDFERVSLL